MMRGTLSGALWLQGEGDTRDMQLAETYAKRLDTMIVDLRKDLGRPNLPFAASMLCEEFEKREDVPNATIFDYR